jgi:hypothetical protein
MKPGVGNFLKTRFASLSRGHGANGNGQPPIEAVAGRANAPGSSIGEAALQGLSPFRLLALMEQRRRSEPGPPRDAESAEIQSRIRRYLDHPDWRIRNVGVKLVGLVGWTDMIPILLAMLTDRTPDTRIRRLFGGDFRQVGFIRRNIVRILGDLGQYGPAVREALIGALRDPYYEVRSVAAATLRRLAAQVGPDPEVVAGLLRCLEDGSFEVITEAAQALGRIGGQEAAAPVLELYGHSSWRVREAALQTTHQLIERGVITEPDQVEEALNRLLIPCPSFRPGFPLRAELRELSQDLKRLRQG